MEEEIRAVQSSFEVEELTEKGSIQQHESSQVEGDRIGVDHIAVDKVSDESDKKIGWLEENIPERERLFEEKGDSLQKEEESSRQFHDSGKLEVSSRQEATAAEEVENRVLGEGNASELKEGNKVEERDRHAESQNGSLNESHFSRDNKVGMITHDGHESRVAEGEGEGEGVILLEGGSTDGADGTKEEFTEDNVKNVGQTIIVESISEELLLFLEGEFDSRMKEVQDLNAVVDPVKTPYRSMYAADEILGKLQNSINGYLNATSTSTERLRDMKALTDYVLGINGLNTDENHRGELHLQAFFDHVCPELELSPMRMEWIGPVLDGLNRIGVLWSERQDLTRSQKYLQKAEVLYRNWKQQEDQSRVTKPFPYCGYVHDVEYLYTHTLFYLAQLYKLQNMASISAEYCYRTLKRQLETERYDAAEWAGHCVNLAEYYMQISNFQTAYECLCAAAALNLQDEELEANVQLGFGRLYRSLLVKEADRRSGKDDDPPFHSKPANLFPSLLPHPDFLPPVLNLEDARITCSTAEKHFRQGMDYYVLDGYVSDHYNILFDLISLYQALAVFEVSRRRKVTLHTKCIGLIEPLVEELNPSFYISHLQQIMFRLGELFMDIIELKVASRDEAEAAGRSTRKKDSRINGLVDQAIKYFSKFLKTMKEDELGQNEEAFLASHFAVARLYTKYVYSSAEECISYLSKALAEYSWLSEYADRHHPTIFSQELGLCKQMATLLPHRIHMLALGGGLND